MFYLHSYEKYTLEKFTLGFEVLSQIICRKKCTYYFIYLNKPVNNRSNGYNSVEQRKMRIDFRMTKPVYPAVLYIGVMRTCGCERDVNNVKLMNTDIRLRPARTNPTKQLNLLGQQTWFIEI